MSSARGDGADVDTEVGAFLRKKVKLRHGAGTYALAGIFQRRVAWRVLERRMVPRAGVKVLIEARALALQRGATSVELAYLTPQEFIKPVQQ